VSALPRPRSFESFEVVAVSSGPTLVMKKRRSKYTDAECAQILNEVQDPHKIALLCAKHLYAGKGPPTCPDCPDCWTVFYIHLLAETPPFLREQRLAELEEIVHHAIELEDKGRWDFKPFAHPQIEVRKEK